MLKRLLFALVCALIGGALGGDIGGPPSVMGGHAVPLVAAAIGFLTGIGVQEPILRRIPYGLLGALVGSALGYLLGHFVLLTVGGRVCAFAGAWLGFAMGSTRSVSPAERL